MALAPALLQCCPALAIEGHKAAEGPLVNFSSW
jgi:hypothetical protein